MADTNQNLVQRYRPVAVWGGAALGGIAAFVGAQPHFGISPSLAGIVAAACAAGAAVGYFFFELVIADQIAGPRSAVSGDGIGGYGGDGGDGGGDGGGGGK